MFLEMPVVDEVLENTVAYRKISNEQIALDIESMLNESYLDPQKSIKDVSPTNNSKPRRREVTYQLQTSQREMLYKLKFFLLRGPWG